jgi:Peroxisome biogenesis factor 1, N-terminal
MKIRIHDQEHCFALIHPSHSFSTGIARVFSKTSSFVVSLIADEQIPRNELHLNFHFLKNLPGIEPNCDVEIEEFSFDGRESSLHSPTVKPASPDDWELVTLNSSLIEIELLNQIHVLTPQLIFPFWTSPKSKPIFLKATVTQATLLKDEVIVEPNMRIITASKSSSSDRNFLMLRVKFGSFHDKLEISDSFSMLLHPNDISNSEILKSCYASIDDPLNYAWKFAVDSSLVSPGSVLVDDLYQSYIGEYDSALVRVSEITASPLVATHCDILNPYDTTVPEEEAVEKKFKEIVKDSYGIMCTQEQPFRINEKLYTVKFPDYFGKGKLLVTEETEIRLRCIKQKRTILKFSELQNNALLKKLFDSKWIEEKVVGFEQVCNSTEFSLPESLLEYSNLLRQRFCEISSSSTTRPAKHLCFVKGSRHSGKSDLIREALKPCKLLKISNLSRVKSKNDLRKFFRSIEEFSLCCGSDIFYVWLKNIDELGKFEGRILKDFLAKDFPRIRIIVSGKIMDDRFKDCFSGITKRRFFESS